MSLAEKLKKHSNKDKVRNPGVLLPNNLIERMDVIATNLGIKRSVLMREIVEHAVIELEEAS